ncbi:transcription factor-like 5 protein isoform X2 [Melanotaenia boesemani]|uniref:transcription factor-like 5 protein isoform X2 n=1 Tax=Melanotaenia boesemani TaxID=1250792 RepID=UPI001C054F66|nr:transcription factor-like 5 protein isoform X2 [Melanotaenia boesemani]
MSSIFPADKAVNGSPPSCEHSSDLIGLGQDGCVTQGQEQMLGSELGLMEMTDNECSHLQHLIQAHMEVHAGPLEEPDARPHPATVMVKETTGSTVIYPLMSTQAIDLSTSSDDYSLVMSGEKTPVTYGDVPSFVLARIRDEESLTEPPAKKVKSSQYRSRVAARVCLEKRFDSMCAETTPQDIHSAVLNKAEAQEVVMHPQNQKRMKNEKANPFEVSSSYVADTFDQVTNICSQVIANMVVPNKPQSLIMPKSFSFNFHSESPQTVYANSSIPRTELVKMKTNVTKPARSSVPLSQRRERHNSKERERRKRIRLYCDELNTMVPFCNSDTDKATTLQWTTAYLRYINKTYGNTFNEEFQKVFTRGRGGFLKSIFSPAQLLINQEMDETLSIPLAAEQ